MMQVSLHIWPANDQPFLFLLTDLAYAHASHGLDM